MIPGSSEMRICVVILGLCLATLSPPVDAQAQNSSSGGWMIPDWNKPPITDANKKPAPRRSLAGTWGPAGGAGAGTQASGVQLKPNNGKPENQLPYTPYGLELYRSNKALEGVAAVLPTQDNDPRNSGKLLRVARCKHNNISLTPIWQDDYRVVIL